MRAYDWRLFIVATYLLWLAVGLILTQPPDHGDIARVTLLSWLGVAMHLGGGVLLIAFVARLRLPGG